MHILGISSFYHDSAAALVSDGKIVAAAQEERFTRKKHDEAFPSRAVEYCLRAGSITISDIDLVVFYDKPLLKFERLLQTYLGIVPRGLRSFVEAIPVWLREKLWIPDLISRELNYSGEILFTEHHLSHAASAFFPSPFQDAAVLTIDGVGEWVTNSVGSGEGNSLSLLREIHFPHSLGLLYSAFTYFCGFRVNSGEYKLMGLAPYGEPRYVNTIRDALIDIRDDGSYRLNLHYFNYLAGLTMTNHHFDELFGGVPRSPESKVTQREMDIARSIQEVTEEVMLRQANFAHGLVGSKNLVMAGGVALNCVGNGRILREGPFDNIWIQPASGDAGGALGAALAVWYQYLGNERPLEGPGDSQQGSLLGPSFSSREAETMLLEAGAVVHRIGEADLYDEVAHLLASGEVIGWFQGRMEFGPRALGARSIIGDARSPEMQKRMNLKIKFRESFRPFAPAVLREHAAEYFDLQGESPYMLLVSEVAQSHKRAMSDAEKQLFGIDKLNIPRSDLPAVTHVDYSARVQTVSEERNAAFTKLLRAFYRNTGCPVLVNTSFNVRGEPIVCTPKDAYRCFMRTEMDTLVVEDLILRKSEQPRWQEKGNWQDEFSLD